MPTAAEDIAHLLRRAGFGATSARVAQYAPYTREQIVDSILDNSSVGWPETPTALFSNLSQWEKVDSMRYWWLERMVTAPVPIVEKMTLFWHGHFTASLDKVHDAEYLWRMHLAHRVYALGNIRTMAQDMAVQPAMLWYLDNEENYAESPNQNFGRELLELFLLGVGKYTEPDVVACTRAWTGHHLNRITKLYEFRAKYHDATPSTFLGETRAWNGPDIINFLFDHPVHRVQVARHFATKLWTFFAYPNPPEAVIAGLANVMVAGGFEVRPVLRALLLRDEFWSVTARQGLVRSPVEYVVNVLQQVGLSATFMQVTWMVESMGQNLFSPPNVSGWRPNGYWLSTAAASMKHEFANAITWRLEQANRATPLEPITSLSVDAAVARVFDQLGVVAPSDRSRAVLTAWLVTQRATLYQGWAEGRQMLALALMLPEMQLA